MNKVGFVFAFVSFSFVAGCFAGPPVVASDTDAGVAPAADGGTVTPAVDAGPAAMADAGMPAPGTDAGVAPATPDAGPPAPETRFCGDGALIGDRIRLVLTDMTGLRTFAGVDLHASNAGTVLWTFYGTQYTYAPGSTVELASDGGTLNVHFYEGGALTFDSHMADLQHVSSATSDVKGESRGIHLQALRSGSWVDVPEGFLYFGPDTDARRRWGASGDPLIPTGDPVGRLQVEDECEHQFQVYESSAYRAAR